MKVGDRPWKPWSGEAELGVATCVPWGVRDKSGAQTSQRIQEPALSPRKVKRLFFHDDLCLPEGVCKGRRAMGTLTLTVKLRARARGLGQRVR